jgi:hypothetical protein
MESAGRGFDLSIKEYFIETYNILLIIVIIIIEEKRRKKSSEREKNLGRLSSAAGNRKRAMKVVYRRAKI